MVGMSRLNMSADDPRDWTIECSHCDGRACASCVAPRVHRLEQIEFKSRHSVGNRIRRSAVAEYPERQGPAPARVRQLIG